MPPFMASPTIHKIGLPQFSVDILLTAMETPGWTKNIGEFVQACSVVGKLNPEKTPAGLEKTRDQREAGKSFPEWADKKIELELTEREREVVKAGIKAWLEPQGKLVPGPYTRAIVSAFGLEE
jgi:hypothetical protein